ncbi:MAG: hypothetical protein H7333_02725 [Bdellovibrionales bacterium]|nr:hypothetical protein [Oligoflexia bacterium]
MKEAYPSLFEYAVKALGYSEAASFRRISAMRLMKQIPEVKTAIDEGRLNLSQLTQAQAFFKQEEKAAVNVKSSLQSWLPKVGHANAFETWTARLSKYVSLPPKIC